MGLLDDAIREHLELKRRRGADPGEVERQENEALGAKPQAEFAQAPEAEPAEAAPEAEEPAEEPVAEAAEPVDAGEEREPFDVEASQPPAPTPDPEPEAAAPEPAPPETDPWLEDERDEVPAEEALAHPREEGEEEGEEPAEDVLEDTPDFLQETPEHDRLWFEQRPPRDFDWDK
jgi:hypothetical protein